jgi:hypothetical protein
VSRVTGGGQFPGEPVTPLLGITCVKAISQQLRSMVSCQSVNQEQHHRNGGCAFHNQPRDVSSSIGDSARPTPSLSEIANRCNERRAQKNCAANEKYRHHRRMWLNVRVQRRQDQGCADEKAAHASATWTRLGRGSRIAKAYACLGAVLTEKAIYHQLPVQVGCVRRHFARSPSDKLDHAHYSQEPERQEEQSIQQYQRFAPG